MAIRCKSRIWSIHTGWSEWKPNMIACDSTTNQQDAGYQISREYHLHVNRQISIGLKISRGISINFGKGFPNLIQWTVQK